MPRTVRNPKIDTRSARSRLPARREPYFAPISPGCALGYRKGATGGTWIARRYDKAATPRLRYKALGSADDTLDADGATVLTFTQAQELARAWFAALATDVHGAEEDDPGPYTVADSIRDYLAHLEAQGKATAKDARWRADALILPELGAIELRRVRADRLEKWLEKLATTAARLRTKRGEKQKFRALDAADPEATRRRRANANRTFTVLRAALNLAFNRGKVAGDTGWRRVKPFRGADAARVRYLQVAEAKRLVNACPPDFRALVRGALFTGARYSELSRLDVADFNADSGTVMVRQSKTGRPRPIYLTDEGKRFFEAKTAGRAGGAPMLPRADGGRWGRAHQRRPMVEACAAARIDPPISFHGLRHTWASLAVMAGVPLQVVAANLGHSDTRMVEKHYGHLSDAFIAKAIRDKAPKFGFRRANVIRMGDRRKHA
jgi:integrase